MRGEAGKLTQECERTVDEAVSRATQGLLALQREDGHWCFEFEADCTIPSEYILMMHYMDEVDPSLSERLARYIKRHQNNDGGWPLYPGGEVDISCSVKAYYALKLAGEDPEASHMVAARNCILARGGAARANVFTRIMLAQFRQIPWRGVPFIPVELMLAPSWMFIHINKVSYWSRTVMVPLFILVSLRRQARNPTGIGIDELFVIPPQKERRWFPVRSVLNRVFLFAERTARHLENLIPWGMRRAAIRRAELWMIERLNGEGGLGAIFPAMVNAYEALDALGYSPNHPLRQTAKRALELLLIDRNEEAYCQPCVSPVWDTGLSLLALEEAGANETKIRCGLKWLADRQLLEEKGDWQQYCGSLPGGGWAFQYRNDYYPDLDDTSVVAWAMHRVDPRTYGERIRRAADWLVGMQSQNGGFGAFDANNTSYYLNEIPFADHGALLDPPTEDVSARCLTLFSCLGEQYSKAAKRVFKYLLRLQRPEGCWWGRWGTNYIYGTWSVLVALERAGIDPKSEAVQRAVGWLHSIQNDDGGFGESNDTYYEGKCQPGMGSVSTPEQTAWAILAFLAAGEVHSESVQKAIEWLLNNQNEDGLWSCDRFNAPGFPRVFYLRYHGYSAYFPLWALARYRSLIN